MVNLAIDLEIVLLTPHTWGYMGTRRRAITSARANDTTSVVAAVCSGVAFLGVVRYLSMAAASPMATEAAAPNEAPSTPPPISFQRSFAEGGATKYHTFRTASDGQQLSIAAAAALMADPHDGALRETLTAVLRNSEFEAFFWEMPPVTSATMASTPFEFILNDSPGLAQVSEGEPESFAEHLSEGCGSAGVRSFYNLGRDALLVSPCEIGPRQPHAHMASFVRAAPAAQVDTLWRRVGEGLARRVGEVGGAPVWTSTSGLGVYWLHVRLDSRPKYYTFAPYKMRRT